MRNETEGHLGQHLLVTTGVCRCHFKKFPSRLRSARQQGIQKKGSRAVSENAAFEHDRLLFPPATHNQRGEPRWHGSPAESLLKHDVAEKRHEKMAPQLLRETRVEYM